MGFSSILIVDDDAAMQARLARLVRSASEDVDLDLRFASDLSVARMQVTDSQPDLALVDMQLPDGNGVDLICWMQTNAPHVQAVIVSAYAEEELIFSALRAGAIGYLMKDRDDIELTVALRSVQRGGAPIDPMIARRILSMLPVDPPTPAAMPLMSSQDTPAVQLSERELGILNLVAQGYGNREIADLLGLSRLTIEAHTRNIYRKLAVGSRTAAVFEARVLGLLK